MSTIKRRYTLARELGRGATGVVWSAQDTQLGRQVAIKLLHPDLDPDYLRLAFENEARTIAQLRSPHIVQVFDSGVDHGQPFIVMELLAGESLEAKLERHPRLPLRMVADIFGEIASAIATVHRAGIVHRDLKPANMFLSRELGREVVKLLDFGIAALVPQAASLVAAGQPLAGTPRYISPEQFLGASADQRTDIWSLGVVVYEMLTGTKPFAGDSLASVRQRVLAASPAPASTLVSDLPSQIDTFFARALALDPSQRFSSVQQMADELLEVAQTGSVPVVRILLVDDECDMDFLLRQQFRQQVRQGRYEIFFATDGEAALRLLAQRPDIDVILSDIMMPGMDGLTFLSKVPEVNALARVVMVSAYSDMANIRSAMNSGAFDFLCKPIDLNDLERTIEKTALHVAALRGANNCTKENGLLRAALGHGAGAFLNVEGASVAFSDAQYVQATIVSWRLDRCLEDDESESGGEEGGSSLRDVSEGWAAIEHELVAEGVKLSTLNGHTALTTFCGDAHAERAARVALNVLRYVAELSPDPTREGRHNSLAVGISTGTILSAAAGTLSSRVEAVSLGRPARQAVLLQTVALRNEILICPATQRVLAGSPQFQLVPIVVAERCVSGVKGSVALRGHRPTRASESSTPFESVMRVDRTVHHRLI